MMFLFTYLATLQTPPGWPIRLMHLTEAAFVIVAFAGIVLASIFRGRVTGQLFAVIGGLSASFGLIMPFELAPFFFDVGGEAMMATLALNLLYLPVAIFFIYLFQKSTRVRPPPLPVQK